MERHEGVNSLPAHGQWKHVAKEMVVTVQAGTSPLHMGSNTSRDEYGGMLKYALESEMCSSPCVPVHMWKYIHVSQTHRVLFREVVDVTLVLGVGPPVDGKIVFTCTGLEGNIYVYMYIYIYICVLQCVLCIHMLQLLAWRDFSTLSPGRGRTVLSYSVASGDSGCYS